MSRPTPGVNDRYFGGEALGRARAIVSAMSFRWSFKGQSGGANVGATKSAMMATFPPMA